MGAAKGSCGGQQSALNFFTFLGTSPERYFSKKSPPKTKRSEQIQIIYCYDYHHLCSVTLALIEEIFEAKRTLSTILCNVSIIDENRSQLVKTVARSGFKADTSRDAIINFSDSSRGLAERILSIHLPFVPTFLSLDCFKRRQLIALGNSRHHK